MRRRRSKLICTILDGAAQPGYEPEAAYATAYSFTHVGWFDLRDPTTWDEEVISTPTTYGLLQRSRAALGYVVAEEDPIANAHAQPDCDIATAEARVRVLILHTREALMVAREVRRLV